MPTQSEALRLMLEAISAIRSRQKSASPMGIPSQDMTLS